MQSTVEFLLHKLFGDDAEFVVSENITDDNITTITIDCEEEYKPRVIGKRGRIIKSIHNLTAIKAKREGVRIRVKVSD
ncbi:KH domain-containing protein [Candidatus Dojkabacteria bacterium]|uniref:KH domain-containing protein n=1 Tax=Candidatus Dojkabacteria bacterium TaxID=2099670 RepID=A0A955RK85_9BACT|nr:KH domain-containing protein [Candidatus Dojkabacteria bacterium]